MKLYQINEMLETLLECSVDKETGELKPESIETLDKLMAEKEKTALELAKHIKNLDSDIVALKKEEESLNARRKSLENKVLRLKEYLVTMISGKKYCDSQAEIAWRKSVVLEIVDATKLSDVYKIKTVVEKIDKTFIKSDIKRGIEVKGVNLVTKNNIQIR